MLRTKEDAGQDSPSREDAIDGPFEYLLTSSGASIESFHLSRLNAVANLRKELHELFEEWVEAEVQARLAQWLLARKNSENLAAAGSITIASTENRNAQIAATPSTTRSLTRSPTRTTSRRTAAADSAARSCVVRLNSTASDDSNHSSIKSRIRGRAIGAKNRAARTFPATLTSRPLITHSASVIRTPRFPAFVHLVATPESATTSKSNKATTTLLSFRHPNRNSIAI
ncbi:MAG TPA: hypothetical protein VOA88_22130 [Candidatus Dormibacteraeota bacterium]|nr:hypothetical protein [Candidatus Dormibacteraeota bacterium]